MCWVRALRVFMYTRCAILHTLREFISVVYRAARGRTPSERANWMLFFEKPAKSFTGHAFDTLIPHLNSPIATAPQKVTLPDIWGLSDRSLDVVFENRQGWAVNTLNLVIEEMEQV